MRGSDRPSFFPFGKEQMLPAEEMLEVGRKRQKLIIGIPGDHTKEETRVALTPQAVELLVKNDHTILFESGAGAQASYTDVDYADAGAIVTNNRKEVFQADIIMGVAPFSHDDVDIMRGNQTVISSMRLNSQCKSSLQKMMQKKICAIAYEYLKDEYRRFPVMESTCEIAGSTAIMIASEYLSNAHQGKGVLLGGITGVTPAEVVILGSGTAAINAARTALGLGAEIKVFDNSIHSMRLMEEKLGKKIFTSVFQPQVLIKALQSADVVLGALTFISSPKFVVPENYIRKMKEGAVIVDLCISQGGCFETSMCTTFKKPAYRKLGVIHYCIPNLAARVARTSSIALSNIFAPILIDIGEIGGMFKYIKSSKGFRNGIYLYNGILTSPDLGNKFGLSHQDIELLIAAF
ncbi:alanine dehydrogenase [Puteibacter caeruleilacunae]|nr:alanine dehydrogenase [Puteibacter caeruleilacunae]